MKKILFTGGGSAGHVIPNIALMEQVLSAGIADVCYMGTNGIEKRLISDWKIPFYQIDCPKLIRGRNWDSFRTNLRIPMQFHHAKKQALEGLNTCRPDLVFSKGGYVALPVVFAAKSLGIPCFAHESDFSLGLANRLSVGKCDCLFTSFPETAANIKKAKYSGAPIRRSVLSATKAEARKKFGIPFHEKVILIFGGGSGSETINEAVRKHLKTLTETYCVLHIRGKGNLTKCNVKNYRQFEFITDMGMAYACSDLIISRAGAGAVFEILALKKPSILIPLEGQTRGDQQENADYFSQKGLCVTLSQSNLHRLPSCIDETLQNKTLQQRLNESDYGQGNEIILREIKKRLRI